MLTETANEKYWESTVVKLVDFGTARNVANGMCYTMIGTEAYAAPEVLLKGGKKPYVTFHPRPPLASHTLALSHSRTLALSHSHTLYTPRRFPLSPHHPSTSPPAHPTYSSPLAQLRSLGGHVVGGHHFLLFDVGGLAREPRVGG